MRIIVMGSSEFTLPALEKLSKTYNVIAVYTREAKPSGRGLKCHPTPVAVCANQLNIPVYTPKNFKNPEEIHKFKALNADMAVVAAYGLILPKDILNSPRLGCLNIHGSLLPRWRGAAPIHRAIMAGDSETGVTIMHMSEGLDEGDIYTMRTTPISFSDTTGIIHDRLANMGADLLVETIEQIKAQTIMPYAQDHSQSNYATKIAKQDCILDYKVMNAEMIIRKINALNPFPSGHIIYQGYLLKIHQAEIVDNKKGVAGTIDDDFIIYCANGAIRPLIVQKEGKQKQSLRDFLNGVKGSQALHK